MSLVATATTAAAAASKATMRAIRDKYGTITRISRPNTTAAGVQYGS
jgi:hypothetical protein